MAYIPKDDDEQQQSGMNILAPQGQQQNTQPDAQNQPQNISGGQSATVDSGQAQQSSQGQSQAPKGQQKKAKSGMFTNIRKYIDQNKAGAQNMSGKLQQNVSQQNQNIQQAIGKQKNDFMSRVNQNRQRMQGAQQFGQQTLQSAQTQESMPMLQQQQQDMQQRVGQFGDINNQYVTGYQEYLQNYQPEQPQQTQSPEQYDESNYWDYVNRFGVHGTAEQQEALRLSNVNQELSSRPQAASFEDYTKGQLDYSGANTAYNEAQKAYQDAQSSLDENIAGAREQGLLDGIEKFSYKGNTDYYGADEIQSGLASGNRQYLDLMNNQISAKEDESNELRNSLQNMERYGQTNNPTYKQMSEKLQGLDSQVSSLKNITSTFGSRNETLQGQQSSLSRLEGVRDSLSRSKEEQRLYENKQQLQGKLAQIQDRMENAPESLTEDDIKRFNQLRTGVERFDDAILNLSEQKRGVQDLTSQVEALGTSQGRRDLMRQEFGRQGGYTSGQAALDNLVLTGDVQGMNELVKVSKNQAEQAQNALDQAFKEGKITQDEMARGTRNIQKDLQEGVEQAQAALQQGLEDRAKVGEGSFTSELRNKLLSGQGLSAEDLSILGIEGTERFNVDKDNLLRNLEIDPNQFSIQDVANLTDVARADALARLSGEEQQSMLLNEKEIERRSLRGAGDEFARKMDELSDVDKESVRAFRNELESSKKFTSPEQAVNAVRSNITKVDGRLDIMQDTIMNIAKNGSYRNASPEQKQAMLNQLNDNYHWSRIGQTKIHRPWINELGFDTIRRAIEKADAEALAVADAYSDKGSFLSESRSGYEDIDFVKNKLRG